MLGQSMGSGALVVDHCAPISLTIHRWARRAPETLPQCQDHSRHMTCTDRPDAGPKPTVAAGASSHGQECADMHSSLRVNRGNGLI